MCVCVCVMKRLHISLSISLFKEKGRSQYIPLIEQGLNVGNFPLPKRVERLTGQGDDPCKFFNQTQHT